MDAPIEPAAEPVPQQIVAVRLHDVGTVGRYEVGSVPLRRGDLVVVPVERGTAVGTVVLAPETSPHADQTYRRVIRKADARDMARDDANQDRAREALKICWQRIRETRLPMKLIKVDRLFDGTKIVVYFAADTRVDFRQLVRDLAHSLHTRIEMKQVGARDETKVVGGVGPCGRELCCSSWLTEFAPVSVKMAKEQGLSPNPSKLAGMCGRLKCCLRYEYDTYLELGRALPNIGKKVVSVKGDGVVVRRHVLKQMVTLRREDGVEVDASLDDLVEQKTR